MNILCDQHHAGLLYSLQLLLEDRLFLNVWVPVGGEWWDEGYWRFGEVFGDDRLAQQYLRDPEGHGWVESTEPLWTTTDVEFPERTIYGVTLAQAREMDWWGVMPSVQENQRGFHRFATEHNAKYLCQVGNTGQQVDWSLHPLALISAEAKIPAGERGVVYHQEFSLDTFWHDPYCDGMIISSLVNCFDRIPDEWERFNRIRDSLGEFIWRVYGHDGADGRLVPTTKIARTMRGSMFGYHDKPQGDGFGHVIHNWAASGRPLIGTAAYYKGRMPERLWEDGVTAIFLDRKSDEQVVREIREVAVNEERWVAMGTAIRERFDTLVDYDAEATQIRALLGL